MSSTNKKHEKKLIKILGKDWHPIMKKYYKYEKATERIGGSLSTMLQNQIRRQYQKSVPNLRLLEKDEGIHVPTTNYCGPKTNLKSADKYGVVNDPIYGQVDKVCQKHDYAYRDTGKLPTQKERDESIYKADADMLDEMEMLPDNVKSTKSYKAAKLGIQIKHKAEKALGKVFYGAEKEKINAGVAFANMFKRKPKEAVESVEKLDDFLADEKIDESIGGCPHMKGGGSGSVLVNGKMKKFAIMNKLSVGTIKAVKSFNLETSKIRSDSDIYDKEFRDLISLYFQAKTLKEKTGYMKDLRKVYKDMMIYNEIGLYEVFHGEYGYSSKKHYNAELKKMKKYPLSTRMNDDTTAAQFKFIMNKLKPKVGGSVTDILINNLIEATAKGKLNATQIKDVGKIKLIDTKEVDRKKALYQIKREKDTLKINKFLKPSEISTKIFKEYAYIPLAKRIELKSTNSYAWYIKLDNYKQKAADITYQDATFIFTERKTNDTFELVFPMAYDGISKSWFLQNGLDMSQTISIDLAGTKNDLFMMFEQLCSDSKNVDGLTQVIIQTQLKAFLKSIKFLDDNNHFNVEKFITRENVLVRGNRIDNQKISTKNYLVMKTR